MCRIFNSVNFLLAYHLPINFDRGIHDDFLIATNIFPIKTIDFVNNGGDDILRCVIVDDFGYLGILIS